MKISNKILAATSMLLVSVIMLGTATYAWFAMNTRSVANGLTVEAYSDSNFLEISSNEDNTFGINTTFQDASGLLRLVTPKFMEDGEIVTLSITTPTDTYYDGTGTYHKKGDSDIGAGTNFNYLHVEPKELVASTSTANLYMDMVFVVETSDELVNTDGDKTQYYEFSKNVYTGVSLNGTKSAKGLYKVGYYAKASATYHDGTTYYSKTNGKFTKLVIDNTFDTSDMSSYYVIVTGNIPNTGAAYDGVSAFFKNTGDASSPVYERVGDITYGTKLAEYYVVEETVVDIANNPTSDGQSVYYLKNEVEDAEGNTYTDYSYIGTVPSGELLENYLYWGRAYSNDPTAVQENNTLNIINPDGTDDNAVTNYYLHKTLYLRQAEGTNNASDLRIEDVRIGGAKNELSNALRVLFVAYSEHDKDTLVTYVYDPANDRGAESEVLFSTLLGNEAEKITVEVYIYFDGMDEDANNKQVAGAVLNGQTVEIEFAIDELGYNKD